MDQEISNEMSSNEAAAAAVAANDAQNAGIPSDDIQENEMVDLSNNEQLATSNDDENPNGGNENIVENEIVDLSNNEQLVVSNDENPNVGNENIEESDMAASNDNENPNGGNDNIVVNEMVDLSNNEQLVVSNDENPNGGNENIEESDMAASNDDENPNGGNDNNRENPTPDVRNNEPPEEEEPVLIQNSNGEYYYRDTETDQLYRAPDLRDIQEIFSPEMQATPSSYFMQRLRRAIFSMDHATNRTARERAEAERPPGDPADGENGATPLPPGAVRFDTSLPAEHTYLGNNLIRVSGVNYLDVGQTHCIMLFVHQYLLFPGEILPFMTHDSLLEPDFESANGALFGVCFPFLCKSEEDDTLYGVTCQVYEKGHDGRDNIVIKSRALQRFVTKRSTITGTLQHLSAHPLLKCQGQVRILPEIFLPEPLKCIHMGSMARFRDLDTMKSLYKRYQAASTPWPVHVFDYYSIDSIVEQARTQLAQHKIENMPSDPIQLSYWLIRNLHLYEEMMNKAFLTDSVNVRLKLIATTFKEATIFRCRFCNSHIANCRELFAMSKHGVQSQYCNSAGFIHETNTVYQCMRDAITYSGEPSTEYSWFPGYQWQIICCRICYRHLGWEFKAVEPNLVPKMFYGISSSNVRVSNFQTFSGNPRDVIYRLMRISQASMR